MNNPVNRMSSTTRTLTQLALLTAVILVMAYTPLGYLRVGPLTMSLLTVPVAIGAMLVGPVGGAWLGLVFGLTSFMNAVNGTGGLTAFAFQYNPVFCFITCVVARVACGLCCGLLYKGAGLGTVLSFMMAVTTLSLPSLILLKKAVKPKLLAAFVGICTVGIIVVGYIFNAIQFLLV